MPSVAKRMLLRAQNAPAYDMGSATAEELEKFVEGAVSPLAEEILSRRLNVQVADVRILVMWAKAKLSYFAASSRGSTRAETLGEQCIMIYRRLPPTLQW